MTLNLVGGFCKGLTFEPASNEWTLRASDVPRQSASAEISILKKCFSEGSFTFLNDQSDYLSSFHIMRVIKFFQCLYQFLMLVFCGFSENCEKIDYHCSGKRLVFNGQEYGTTWNDCGKLCLFTDNCKKWHWYGAQNKCFMYNKCDFKKSDSESKDVAGTKSCPGIEG